MIIPVWPLRACCVSFVRRTRPKAIGIVPTDSGTSDERQTPGLDHIVQSESQMLVARALNRRIPWRSFVTSCWALFKYDEAHMAACGTYLPTIVEERMWQSAICLVIVRVSLIAFLTHDTSIVVFFCRGHCRGLFYCTLSFSFFYFPFFL